MIYVHPGAKRYFLEHEITHKHFFDIREFASPPSSTFKSVHIEMAG